MKKILASLGFIAAFTGYALYQNSSVSADTTGPVAASSSDPSASRGTSASSNSTASQTTPTQKATSAKTSSAPPAPKPKPAGQYADGTYTGASANAYYGYVQVRAIVSGGRITDVKFLQYPNDRSTSREINSQAIPYLTQEALSAQSANVDIVSGATDTSDAFRQSLASALAQAHT